jgi:hypothetical protein
MLKTHATIIKEIGTTFDVKSTICLSSANKRKTQVGWVITIRQKMQRWAIANNVLPNGFPYHVPNSDEMIMRSPC